MGAGSIGGLDAQQPFGTGSQGAVAIHPSASGPGIRLGRGVLYGVGAALVGGSLWGVVGVATGYVFSLAAVAIGLLVAWAVRRGSGGVTVPVILNAVVLTIFAVFIGDVVAWSIILAPYGATPLDVIGLYPDLVGETSGQTVVAYFFGLLGAAYAGYSLWHQAKQARFPSPNVPFLAPTTAAGAIATGIRYRTIGRSMYEVDLEVTFPDAHVLRAYYTTTTGRAEVHVDGQQVAKTRVWGMKKEVPIILPSGRNALVRFHGSVGPKVDVLLDGQTVAAA